MGAITLLTDEEYLDVPDEPDRHELLDVTWPDQSVSRWLQGAPMIAIEIVSPGNTAEEIDRKIEAYLEEGAAEVWVVYPERHKMNVMR